MEGNIPVLKVKGKNICEAWEKSLISLWKNGCDIKSHYDKENDPLSRDCTMIMVIEKPLFEPRVHRGIPTGLEGLEIYRQEFLEGVHDHWIGSSGSTSWDYTYHQRLFGYQGIKQTKTGQEISFFDQIEWAIKELAKSSFSRRILAITWQVEKDQKVSDPPCLQQCWWRILEKNNKSFLNMRTLWRSRDAFKAAFMNLFVLTELQKIMAEKISEICQKKIEIGQHTDVSWSYHIYGKDIEKCHDFLKILNNRSFENRTWNTAFAEPFFEKGRERLKQELKAESEGRGKGVV